MNEPSTQQEKAKPQNDFADFCRLHMNIVCVYIYMEGEREIFITMQSSHILQSCHNFMDFGYFGKLIKEINLLELMILRRTYLSMSKHMEV